MFANNGFRRDSIPRVGATDRDDGDPPHHPVHRRDHPWEPLPATTSPRGHDCRNCWMQASRCFVRVHDGFMARSGEARKVLRELNAEPASASERAGTSLVWTAADRELLTLIGDTIDRRVDLAAHYANADDVKSRVKLSAELRLTEGSLTRLLRQVQTDVPTRESDHDQGPPRRPRTLGPRTQCHGLSTARSASMCRGCTTGCGSGSLRRCCHPTRGCMASTPTSGSGSRDCTLVLPDRAQPDRGSVGASAGAGAAPDAGWPHMPRGTGWLLYTDRRHQWFTVGPDDVITVVVAPSDANRSSGASQGEGPERHS